MDKRFIFTVGLIVLAFVGVVVAGEVPVIAPLVAFLEAGIGFTFGFFFHKESDKGLLSGYDSIIESMKEKITALESTKETKTTSTKTVSSKRPKRATPAKE